MRNPSAKSRRLSRAPKRRNRQMNNASSPLAVSAVEESRPTTARLSVLLPPLRARKEPAPAHRACGRPAPSTRLPGTPGLPPAARPAPPLLSAPPRPNGPWRPGPASRRRRVARVRGRPMGLPEPPPPFPDPATPARDDQSSSARKGAGPVRPPCTGAPAQRVGRAGRCVRARGMYTHANAPAQIRTGRA